MSYENLKNKNQLNYSTFDTVYLKSYIKDFNLKKISEDARKHKGIFDYNYYSKTKANYSIAGEDYYITELCKYNNNLFGLQDLRIKIKKDYSPIISIMFNSKILHQRYFEKINKNNIDFGFENLLNPLNKLLNPYGLNLDKKDLLFEFICGSRIDNTIDINVPDDYTINDFLSACNIIIPTSRRIRKKKNDYLPEGSITYDLSNKQQLNFYDKPKELTESIENPEKPLNSKFLGHFQAILSDASQKLRIETRLNNRHNFLNKTIGLPENEKLNFKIMLDSNINQPKKEFENIINNIENKDFIETDYNINDYKVYKKLETAEGNYKKFGFDNDTDFKINSFLERFNLSKSRRSQIKKEIKQSILFYITKQSLKNNIDYKKILNILYDLIKIS